MSEFTGERLVPGEVDADLWNEHISRYSFAAQFCTTGTKALDAGCGTGYGTSFLAQCAQSVLGIDSSAHAIAFAARQYGTAKAQFAVALCECLPLQNEASDLIIAFEVIEHLAGWRKFLEECDRVLAPGGVLLVSTPNKSQYTESRGPAGPNPFHVHEFEFREFSDELERIFPNVRVFGQNHAESIVFSARDVAPAAAQLSSGRPEPDQAAFFVAVCTKRTQPHPANFVYVPEAANILHERERHIQLLAAELESKNAHMSALQQEHAGLVGSHRAQIAELERSNQWAESLNLELQDRSARILELQREQNEANRWAESLESQLRESSQRVLKVQEELATEQSQSRLELDRLAAELAERTAWAGSLDAALADRVAELARCVDLLHAAEETVHERTLWAQTAQNEAGFSRAKVKTLEALIKAYELSRWVRIGKALHVGPLSR